MMVKMLESAQPAGYAATMGITVLDMKFAITNIYACLKATKLVSIMIIGALALPDPRSAPEYTWLIVQSR